MSNPGSSKALLLPTTATLPGDTEKPGVRAVQAARPFLDDTKFAAVAVVHGSGKRAPAAFTLVKSRLATGRGVIMLPDPDLLPELEGDTNDVAALKKILKPKTDCLVTFASIKNTRVTGGLAWFDVAEDLIEDGYLGAERDGE